MRHTSRSYDEQKKYSPKRAVSCSSSGEDKYICHSNKYGLPKVKYQDFFLYSSLVFNNKTEIKYIFNNCK